MERYLKISKNLFVFVFVFLLILTMSCHKAGGDDTDNGIRYTEDYRQINYTRIVSLGYHEMDKEVRIKVVLSCPKVPGEGTFYLRVNDGLTQVGPDTFVGKIPQKIALDKTHKAYVYDLALPRVEGLSPDCCVYTFRGLFLDYMEIVKTIPWSGCPTDSPGGILYFKIRQ